MDGITRAQQLAMANGNKIILVAQQKNDWRDLLIHVIERCGYEVIEINNMESIAEATSAGPDLILLDLGLLKERAEILIKDLQKHPLTKHIPIICQATYGTEWLVPRITKVGAKEILHKPFDLCNLPSVLRKHLSNEAYCTGQPSNSEVTVSRSAAIDEGEKGL